jgi:hypothetical protein
MNLCSLNPKLGKASERIAASAAIIWLVDTPASSSTCICSPSVTSIQVMLVVSASPAVYSACVSGHGYRPSPRDSIKAHSASPQVLQLLQ